MKNLTLLILIFLSCESPTEVKKLNKSFDVFSDNIVLEIDKDIARTIDINKYIILENLTVTEIEIDYEELDEKDIITIQRDGRLFNIFIKGQSPGKAFIKFILNYKNISKETTFEIIVTENQVNLILEKGINFFNNEEYDSLLVIFNDIKNNLNVDQYDTYYLYRGYSSYKIGDIFSASSDLKIGLRFNTKYSNSDFKFALAIFDFSPFRFHEKSNIYIDDILALDPNYELFLDKSLNHLDLKLIQALNYFEMNQFEEALKKIKLLDSSIELTLDDHEFMTKFIEIANNLSLQFLN